MAETNWNILQRCQNTALRTSTGCTQASAIPHLHSECNILPIKEHNLLLSRQFLWSSTRPEHPNFLAENPDPDRLMKKTLHSEYSKEVGRLCDLDYRIGLKTLHTEAVNNAITGINNKVLGCPPPPIHKSEETLPRQIRVKLAQLRSGYSPILNSYLARIDETTRDVCPLCNLSPHDTNH